MALGTIVLVVAQMECTYKDAAEFFTVMDKEELLSEVEKALARR